jgi:hypothetical protein
MGNAEKPPNSHAVDGNAVYSGGSMARLPERIEALESRLRELKHRQQRVEARKRTLQDQRERREDTRRKILVGALVLTQIERGDYSRERLDKALDAFLTRPGDRALFSLDASTAHADGPAAAALEAKRTNQSELR